MPRFLRCLPFVAALTAGSASAAEPNDVEWFEQRVRPVFLARCDACHGSKKHEAGLRVDKPETLLAAAKDGTLLAALRHQGELKMPPKGKLPERELAAVVRWVERGAALPAAASVPAKRTELPWGFRPRTNPTPPPVKDAAWALTPIDNFALARLEGLGLKPAAPADRRAWLRRATYDLTGLPPTAEELDAFGADRSPSAFAAAVDRLLASPAYGERWGKHWLDVARYADSNGLDENIAFGNAWRYRDYVIASFNADVPFPRFLTEQLAGDLLPAADPAERERLLVATGYLSLGPKLIAEADKEKLQLEIVDEQLDAVGRTFMGLTLGCARCHDHKFDPISTEDYYGLAGVFHSTHTMDSLKTLARWHEHPTPKPEDQVRKAAYDRKLADETAAIAKLLDAGRLRAAAKAKPAVKGAKPTPPTEAEAEAALDEPQRRALDQHRAAKAILVQTPPEPTGAMGVKEGKVEELAVRLRGDPHRPGKVVPRHTPAALAGVPAAVFDAKSSGRLQLANWLADPRHPLTARVYVNRVWRWHFGRGLVASVDNFGRLGTAPADPALLDWLTGEFLRRGGSTKALHRTIMLSNAYRMSGRADPRAASADPEGTTLARFPRRRLEAEELRDSLLLAAGTLDRTLGGSLLHVENRAFFFDHTSIDRTKYDAPRRTVYLPLVRNHLADVLQLFDATDAASVNGDRIASVAPTQALYLMNSDTMLAAARSLADRVLKNGADDRQRLDALHRHALGRGVRSAEADDAGAWLAKAEAALPAPLPPAERRRRAWALLAQTLLASNEFLHVD